jgi:drug/metabolite transporter (DMT)-like permease
MTKGDSPRVGIWMALTAAILFGISAPLAKLLLAAASPQLIAGLLYGGSGVGLSVVALATRLRDRPSNARLRSSDYPWLAGAIFFGGVLGPLFLMKGLIQTAASGASLLLNLEGVFTAAIAWTVFKENVDRRIAVGMALIVAGGAILSWRGGFALGGLGGPLLVILACASWAIDNNLTQKVSASNPVRIAQLKGLVAGVTNIAISLLLGAHFPGAMITLETMLLGFFSYGLSLVLFVAALRRLGTARTSAYFSLGPFVGAALSLVVWREPVTMPFLAAAVLMGIGFFLHYTERHEHRHVHEPMEHSHSHVHDEHHQHSHSPDDPPGEPHTHHHVHERIEHTHAHYPDIHHRHSH